MSGKSILRNAIGNIQPGKPLILPKTQSFTPPSPPQAPAGTSASIESSKTCGKQTQGNLTQGNRTQVEVTHVDLTQGKPTQGDSTHAEPANGPEKSQGFDLDDHLAGRHKRRREKMIEGAVTQGGLLTHDAQTNLVTQHLAEGWGRFAHGLARVLRAPTKHGLKLVDIALVLTVYDRTIAQVSPKMFAPITIEEFEFETGMDGSNLRAALRELLNKSVLQKISHKTVNFWALNHCYFEAHGKGNRTHVKQTQGNRTQGNRTQGNAPCDKQGKSPQVDLGQTNPSSSASSVGNNSEIDPPKNLNQESKKESLSYASDFPEDMRARWEIFEKTGKYGNSKKEREIFQELFIAHGKPFFDLCGTVVSFLETQGNGKTGEEGKIHSPMVWINGHWEMNLNRYQNWLKKEQALKEAQAQRAEKETAKQEYERKQKEAQKREKQEQDEWAAKMESATRQLLSIYPSPTEFSGFVEGIVQQSGCAFTKNSWKKMGWDSPVVKSFVISHFLKNSVEASHSPAFAAATEARA